MPAYEWIGHRACVYTKVISEPVTIVENLRLKRYTQVRDRGHRRLIHWAASKKCGGRLGAAAASTAAARFLLRRLFLRRLVVVAFENDALFFFGTVRLEVLLVEPFARRHVRARGVGDTCEWPPLLQSYPLHGGR